MVSQPETPPMNPEAKKKFAEDVANRASIDILNEFVRIQIDAEAIQNETDKSENKEKVKVSQGIPNSIKEKNNNKQKLTTITQVVRQTLIAIKIDNGTGNHIQRLPGGESGQVLKQLAGSMVGSIDLNDVNENNATYLYHILKLGMDGHLNNAQDLVNAFNSITNLEFIDNNIYDKIANIFQSRLSPAEREQYFNLLKTKSQKQAEASTSSQTKEELIAMRNESGAISSEINAKIEEITNQVNAHRLNGNRRVKSRDPAEQEQEKKDLLINIRADLSINFNQILAGVNSDADLGRQINFFKKKVNDYFNDGIVTEEELKYFYEKIEGFRNVSQKQLNEIRKNEGRGLLETARVYSGTDWTQDEYRLISGLDNADNLAKLVQEEYNGFETTEDWNIFSKKVKGLFEKLFEIPQAQPKLFWDQGFNQLHEAFFYKEFIGKLNNLGNAMKSHDYFRNKKVAIEDFYDEQGEFKLAESEYGPNTRFTGIKNVDIDVGIAIQSKLRNEMVILHEIMEYTHNTNIISQMGMGFDKMAEYSARVSMRDIDLLFHTTDGLSEAYNFYLQSMYQELSSNFHMMPTNFGKLGLISGLDPVEERAYRQLAALKSVTKLNDPQLVRLIRMASGLSKGVFGEFWGAAMTARFPLNYSIEYERNEKTGEYLKNANGKWIIKKFSMQPSYQSIHFPGLEKMLKDLDLDYQLQRFDHPRYWSKMRNAFAPRDFHDKEALHDFYRFNHGDIYKYGDMSDDAFIQGRDNNLAKFDDKFVMWNEKMRTSSVDYFLRSAWRITQYQKYFEYKRDASGKIIPDASNGKPTLDFDATIIRLQGVGPYLVQSFIEDFFDPTGRETSWKQATPSEGLDITSLGLENLAPEVIQRYIDRYPNVFEHYRNSAKKELNNAEKSSLKKFFYEDYIFKRLAKSRPTQFIAMETMRFTPKGEKLLSMKMEEKLYDIYKDRYPRNYIKGVLLPMYIGSIELAENVLWQKKKDLWKTRVNNKDFTKDELDYKDDVDELGLIFDNGEMREKLINYYHLAKTQAGKQPYEKDISLRIDDENYLDNLKTMYKALKDGINDPNRQQYEREADRSLIDRYTSLLANNQGNIKHYLKGNLFDFSEFLFQQPGGRGPERMWNEVAQIATKMTPAFKTMIYDVIPELVKREYPDMHAFEEAVEKTLIKPFKEWYEAIAVIDPDQGFREAKYLVTYLATVMQKDRNMRYKVIGDALSSFARRTWNTQGSFLADHFWSTIRRPTTALDSDGVEALTHTLLSSIHYPLTEKKIVGYKKNFLGIDVPITTNAYSGTNMELVDEVLGVRMRDRLIEAAPMAGPIILIILFLLAKMALDKDKKKG